MTPEPIHTSRLRLSPLPVPAAAALPGGRADAARIIGAALSPDWPQTDLLPVLRRQAAAAPEDIGWGVWLMIEPGAGIVVGDVGFHGPPDEGVVEIGYAVVPDRRRRGYMTEAAGALIDWALRQPDVRQIVAGCVEDNVASIATLERLGFVGTARIEGEIRWRRDAPASGG